MMRNAPLVTVCFVLFALAGCSKDPEVAKREFLASGDQFAGAGKLNEAIVEYRNAVQQDPRFGEARFKLAESLLKNGDMAGAYREFVRAADLMPENVQAQLAAGSMLLATGQFEDAETRANRILQKHDNLEAHLLKANALAGQDKFREAVDETNKAIGLEPQRGPLYSHRGALLQAAGNVVEAEASYKKAIEIDPKSVDALVALGTFYGRAGRQKESEDSLNKALSLDPKHPVANEILADLYLRTNRVKEAERYLKVTAENADTVSGRIRLADYYRTTGRPSEALAILDRAEHERNGYGPARTRKASILYAQGRKQEAHTLLSETITKEPANVEARLVTADFLQSEGKLDEALAHIKTAVDADPGSIPAFYSLGRVQQRRGSVDEAIAAYNEVLKLTPKMVPAQIELSRLHLASGRPKDSLALTQQALTANPGNPAARLVEAQALMSLGQAREAEERLGILAREQPQVAVVHAQIGDLQRQKKNMAAARDAYDKALAVDEVNAQALAGELILDMAEKNPDRAKARMTRALEKSPDDASLLLVAGRLYASLHDFPQAERYVRRVVTLQPSNQQAYELLAAFFRSQGQLDRAVAEFESLAKVVANPVGAHTMIGMLLELQHKIDEARERYERVLALDSNAPVASNNLAWLIAEHGGNLDEALRLAQQAKAALPDSPYVTDTLGWVYYKKGLYPQAADALEESVRKEPRVAVFHYHLGLAYMKRGDQDQARETLEAAMKMDPWHSLSSEAKRVLGSLN